MNVFSYYISYRIPQGCAEQTEGEQEDRHGHAQHVRLQDPPQQRGDGAGLRGRRGNQSGLQDAAFDGCEHLLLCAAKIMIALF